MNYVLAVTLNLLLVATICAAPSIAKKSAPTNSNKTVQTSSKKQEPQEIATMKEFREVLSSKKPVVLMFYAPWCGACKSMKDPFNKIYEQFSNEVRMVKINAENEKCKEALDFFGVEAIPTVVFRKVGVMDTEQLNSTINALLGKKAVAAPQKPSPKVPSAKDKVIKSVPATKSMKRPTKAALQKTTKRTVRT